MTTINSIARELADVIEVDEKTAVRVVQAMFTAMAAELRRKGRISVAGFGILRLQYRPTIRMNSCYQLHLKLPNAKKRWRGPLHRETKYVPGYNIVRFTPSKPLRRLVNPNQIIN
jgi:nucleoid DNA-binding protein